MLELLATAALSVRCNVYYNSSTPVFPNVPCQAWFSGRNLRRVNVYMPHAGRYYAWTVGAPSVTPDPRWPECLRYTRPEGNQFQVYTVQGIQ